MIYKYQIPSPLKPEKVYNIVNILSSKLVMKIKDWCK